MTAFSACRTAMVIFAALLAVSCQTTVPEARFPELSYAHLPPIRLDVARVEVVNEYRPTAAPPNVEHLFPVKPAAAAERWGLDRLKAAGGGGVARMSIKRASVVEVPLARTTGVRAMLTTDQSERYDGVIEVAITVFDDAGRERATVVSRAQRSKSVAEDITLHDRERTWFQMTEAMMNDLNASLETQIREHMGALIR